MTSTVNRLRTRAPRRVLLAVLLFVLAGSSVSFAAVLTQRDEDPAPARQPEGGAATTVPAMPSGGPVGTQVEGGEDATSYWTEDRMDDAQPYPMEVPGPTTTADPSADESGSGGVVPGSPPGQG